MKITQALYQHKQLTLSPNSTAIDDCADQLVLAFGHKDLVADASVYTTLRERFPAASLVLCSTAGEIYDTYVLDHTVSILAMGFEKTRLQVWQKNVEAFPDSYEAGATLFRELDQPDLCYVLVICDGAVVNGSELVRGIQSENKKQVPVTGGLAGDGYDFKYTLVGLSDLPSRGNIIAVGFYGHQLKIGHGSLGGWETFGPEKKVTRSVSNKLFDIENGSALELYKKYLGRYAEELPGSALLFPLAVRNPDSEDTVVRTILSVDTEEGSMTFAGDIPEGSIVRFMKANFVKLIDASTHAALLSIQGDVSPQAALLISCVGRKLILDKRIDEETEAVRDIFGADTFISGFYSYGEISPLMSGTSCELHNQTMTITTFYEQI